MNTPLEIALRAFTKHQELHSLDHYTGILSLQGLAHCAVTRQDPQLVALCRERLLPFVRRERSFACNFKNYLCGGNGAAILFWKGHLPEAAEEIRRYAEELMREAPRDRNGIFSNPRRPAEEQIWIDTAFAVTPFLLYAGLAFREDSYVEEAFQQTRKMVEVFKDPSNGLLHQCKNFTAPGRFSEDHWSRGNGWAMLAIAELVDSLPHEDPRRPEMERILSEFAKACLAYQNDEGLWHHEMTLPSSFVETSGSGLILYGIGAGLAKGVLPGEYRSCFINGLRGYLGYILADGTVENTCEGCRNPGDGSIQAYLTRKPITNDPHAFGPVVLAFCMASRLRVDASSLGR